MKIIDSLKSKDNKTIKYLQKTKDNQMIETGYFNEEEVNICISTQIGCAMGCVFCATSNQMNSKTSNFIRNLTSKEIIQQVENVLKKIDKKKLKSSNILFCFMGMGEPFLNYNNVLKSIKILSKKYSSSRVTICTLGINLKLIRELAREKGLPEIKLHLSFHAPNDKLRKRILPNAQKIKPTLEALKYFSLIKGTSVKLNYVLIKSFNDSQKQAKELAELLKNYPFVVKLSLLNLNDVHKLKPSEEAQFKLFEKILNSKKIKNCRFFPDGTDIQSSCGQLKRNKNQKKE